MKSHELARKLLEMEDVTVFINDREYGDYEATKLFKVVLDAKGNTHTEKDIEYMKDRIVTLQETNTRGKYDSVIAEHATSDNTKEYIDSMLRIYGTFEHYQALHNAELQKLKGIIDECANGATGLQIDFD